MNILIVDDDRFVITALRKKIAWDQLGITGIFTAGNIYQAQEIFKSGKIDILLSDIEMPGGSGLELLSWLRQEHYEVQAIFLTNYANFNYAQKAIALQSFEYYLKPIEYDKLSLILQKAVQKVYETQKARQIQKAGELWNQHESQRSVSFWHDYFKKIWAKESFDPYPLLEHYHISYQSSDLFLSCIADLFPYRLSDRLEFSSRRDFLPDLTQRFCVTAKASCTKHELSLETIMEHSAVKDRFYLVFRFPYGKLLQPEQISSVMTEIQYHFQNACDCDSILRFGSPEKFEALADSFLHLSKKSDLLLYGHNRILCLTSIKDTEDAVPPLNIAALEYQLQTGSPEAFVNAVFQCLHKCIRNDSISAAAATNFRLDITQLIFSHLARNEILAHSLFNNRTYTVLLENSSRSIPGLEDFLRYISYTAFHYIRFSSSKASVVETIRQYIEKNYQNDIARNDFADIVYLNPDHIARIFRREMGISLGAYIIKKRIEVAKNLLANTGFPINVVADKVGYGNYSYFTKLFKKETGFTPNEYRQNIRANAETEDSLPQ